MIYPMGATEQSLDVLVVDDNGIAVTGLTHLTFPTVTWSRSGPNADVALALSALALITTPWSEGGVKERGDGVYRLDIPDAMFSSSGKIRIRGEAADKHLIVEGIEVSEIFSIIEADQYIDTGVVPWAVVYMQKGTGGIGIGTELMRKRLASVTGANLISTSTVVGQVKT